MGKMDLWYGFICHSLDLLRPNGVLCFIAQNNWTTSSSAKIMRNKVIKDSIIKQILDFNTYMVFENAEIQTMIMIFEHNITVDNYVFDYRTLLPTAQKEDMLKLLERQDTKYTKFLSPRMKRQEQIDKLFTFSDDDALLDKISKDKAYLIEDEVTQGIIGNPDNAFKLTKSELPYYTVNELKFIHKFHTHTEKYIINDSDVYLIYLSAKVNPQLDINIYPNIKNKLSLHSKELKNRREVLNKKLSWFFLHWPRKEEIFKKGVEKIITQVRCETPKFCYTTDEYYGSRALFFIQTERWNMKYLIGILNSKLIEFWLKRKGKVQGNMLKLDKEPLLGIPLPKDLPDFEQQKIISLVDKIITTKNNNLDSDISALEEQIDELVYDFYKLTPDDRAIVRNS